MPDSTSLPAPEHAHDQPAQPSVKEIMAHDPAWVPPETSVKDAAALMSGRNIGAVVVCRSTHVVGILTERDLLRAAASGAGHIEGSVEKLMSPSPVTIAAEASWTAAADLMERRGIRHLPVTEAGRLVGMISVRDLMSHRNRHLEWLVGERTRELAAKNADLAERDRLMQYHLDLAGRIQQRLLPERGPTLSPLQIEILYRPLDRVSGDYYDFATLGSGRLGILIADASGHSVPAAFVSVMAKTAFQAYGKEMESPAEVLRTMNERLLDLMEAGQFITMLYAVVDLATLRMDYALAGHPRPLWRQHGNRSVVALDAGGPLLGCIPNAEFEERSVHLNRGDLLLFYTDGVTECRNERREQFGQKRLEQFLTPADSRTHGGLVASLEEELSRFRGGAPAHDDVTCIAMGISL